MNFGQMKERAAYLIAMDGWDKVPVMPDMGTLVNAGLQKWAWDTEYNVSTVTVNTVASQAEYTLPTPDWKHLTDVIYNGQIPLTKSSERALRTEDELWLTRDAATPERFMLQSPNVLRLHPKPSTGSIAVTVRGIQMPAALSADSDTPACPAAFHEAVVLAAVLDHVKQYVKEDADVARVSMFQQEYAEARAKCRTYLASMRNRGASRNVRQSSPGFVQFIGG